MTIEKQIALLNNIPDELKQLNQWVCWRSTDIGSAKPTKIPYNPKTGKKASVTDPSHWSSYNDAVSCLANGGNYNGIGFVLTRNDPYFIGDLDDAKGDASIIARQKEIAEKFDTYSEISPSGMGLHTVGKGSIPNGRRKDCIEIYSSERYITFTGNVYNDKPIKDCQNELTKLYNELSGEVNNLAHTVIIDEPERYSDEEIIEQCRSAATGEKFQKLFAGSWEGDHKSQSEADLAIANLIVYRTKNRNQAIRIFRASWLGKRPKANRSDYVNGLIQKALDQTLPPINFELYNKEIEEKLSKNRPVAQLVEPIPHKNLGTGSNPVGPTITPPPGSGLLNMIAEFIYDAAPRPVYELALAGSIGLMAGVCGRAYNVSNSGLNMYLLALAQTGVGKEAISTGINKLIDSIKFEAPTAREFIGPDYIASGQALAKYIDNKLKSFVCLQDEFGIRLQRMFSEKAPANEKTLKEVMLKIYEKSGKNSVYGSSIYADNQKNTKEIKSPAFSILGYGVPSTFYKSFNDEMLSEGLLNRFMIIEYIGDRKYLNNNFSNVNPKDKKYGNMLERFATLTSYCSQLIYENKVNDVELSNNAKRMSIEFDEYVTNTMNKNKEDEVVLNLWTRAHLKSLKLAALNSVGIECLHPILTKEQLEYSIKIVCDDIRSLLNKHRKGETGNPTSETSQLTVLKKLIYEYYSVKLTAKTYDKFKPYQDNFIIPHSYISLRLGNYPEFYKHVLGRTKSIKQAVEVLLNEGLLVKPNEKYFEKHKLSPLIGYCLTDLNLENLIK